MNAILRSSLFLGPDDSKSLSCYNKELHNGGYCFAGKAIAVSLVHGGPGPESLSRALFESLVTGPELTHVSIEDVTEFEVKQQLMQLADAAWTRRRIQQG